MIGGTLISGVVRVVVVVATLAAAYYFVVRPVLDTTEKVTAGVNGSLERTMNDAFRQTDIPRQQQISITRKVRSASGKDTQRLMNCVSRAGMDVNRLNRCANRFSH